MHFVEYLNDNNQFPNELYPILITALADEDEAVQQSARSVLADVRDRHPEIAADPRFVFEPSVEAPDREAIELRPDYEALLERRRLEQ